MLARSYRHWIGLEESPNCTVCDDEVPEDIPHLLTRCPATDNQRIAIFGRYDPTLLEVFADADRLMTYLRRLGRL